MSQTPTIEPSTDYVFVTRVLQSGGDDNFIFSPDTEHAEACWRALTDRAVEMVSKKREPITTEMHKLTLSDEDAAIRAVKAGQSELVKGLTIRPPKNLRGKVTMNGPRAISVKTLNEAAAAAQDDHMDLFFQTVNQDIEKLSFYRQLLAQDSELVIDHIDEIFQIAYRLSGRGGTFGYGLLAQISDKTCRFILDRISISPKYVQSLIVHLDMIQLIIVQRLEGDGGQAGVSLTKNLIQLHQNAIKAQQITSLDAPQAASA